VNKSSEIQPSKKARSFGTGFERSEKIPRAGSPFLLLFWRGKPACRQAGKKRKKREIDISVA